MITALDAPADRAYRLKVEPDLTVPGHPDIFAVGDTTTIAGPDGNPVPGIAPAAKQQGRYVAELIRARLAGRTLPPFHYKHAGSLAQIGKRLAVIDFGRIRLRGAIAWWINVFVFVLYTGVFLTLLRRMIQREDFGTGPLPDLSGKAKAAQSDPVEAVR